MAATSYRHWNICMGWEMSFSEAVKKSDSYVLCLSCRIIGRWQFFSQNKWQNRGLCLFRSRIWLIMNANEIIGYRIIVSTARINPMVFFGLTKFQSKIPTDSVRYSELWFPASNGRIKQFRWDRLCAGCEIESLLNLAVQIVAQLPRSTADHFMVVPQAFFTFMSDMIRKLYLGWCWDLECCRSHGIQ
jgi:hypothetical protein